MTMMQYLFGQWSDTPLEPKTCEDIGKQARHKQLALAQCPTQDILQLLDDFSLKWNPQSDSGWYAEALRGLTQESGNNLSPSELADTLALLPSLLNKDALVSRIVSELGSLEVLDQFAAKEGYEVRVRAFGRGTLLHVTANNIFLGSIDSLVMGWITKNVSLLKVGSQNTFFPFFFAKKLQEFDRKQILSPYYALLSWKGGEHLIEDVFKKNCDTIILWGGEDMAQSYRQGLESQVKLIEHGPKISIQVLGAQDEDNSFTDTDSIVRDVVRWEQRACSNAQILFVHSSWNQSTLIEQLQKSFFEYQQIHPRPNLDNDTYVELQKERYLSLYHHFLHQLPVADNQEFLLHFDPTEELKSSPLHRTLLIKRFSTAKSLTDTLSAWRPYLQTCALQTSPGEVDEYRTLLAVSGVKRFTNLGKMTESLPGSPHDGGLDLTSLVNWVADERSLAKDSQRSPNPGAPGHIFASGGTTGSPKFIKYKRSEFQLAATLIAKGFTAQGIKRGDRVANVFMSGNLWSSYQVVDQALQLIGCEILGIGGQCPLKDAVDILTKFPPDALVGMPSQLLALASEVKQRHTSLTIPLLLYAGERISDFKRHELTSIFHCKRIGSAGHASVDAGPLGYQCQHSPPNVHHVLKNQVKLIIRDDGQAWVQSHLRTDLYDQLLPTGDCIEWYEPTKPCPCGDSSPRYRLLGRADQQIMIWSARFPLSLFEEVLKDFSLTPLRHQIQCCEVEGDSQLKWGIELSSPSTSPEKIVEQMKRKFYDRAIDLQKTLSREEFSQKFHIFFQADDLAGLSGKQSWSWVVNQRTGKTPLLID